MKNVSKTSKVVLVAVLLSAAFAGGCNRQSPGGGQSSGGTQSSGDMQQSSGGMGSSAGTGADTSGSSGAGSDASSGTSSSGAASKAGATIDDSVITTKVKTALLADPEVKSTDISVETRNGEVMLSGYVRDQKQIDRALQIARSVEGAKGVQNKMAIKSS